MSKQTDLINIPDAITVSGSNVGIGTSSPASKMTISSGVNTDTRTFLVDNAHSGGSMYNAFGVYVGGTDRMVTLSADYGDSIMAFRNNNSERMRLDASGNVLVGTTTQNGYGATFRGGSKYLYLNRDGGSALFVDRGTSDGTLAEFRKDGSGKGSILIKSKLCMVGADMGIYFGTSSIAPVNSLGNLRDNQYDIGDASYRWEDIRATNGTIQTSDFNEKQDIASLTATEMLVGARISALFKTFRWKDKVVEKGDNARTHTGIVAQDVQTAFTAEGLDAGDYALFISDTWWETQTEVPAVEAVAEVTDEDGNVTTEAVEAVDAYTDTEVYKTEAEAPEGATSKTRLGIRYPELLSFVAAYNEQRFASIEARLTALEA
jgi:hypothetical protein